MITMEEIDGAKSEAGGWKKATLAQWGVPWPPPKGWKEMLVAGEKFDANQFTPSPIRPDMNAHDLLRQVVLAVVDAGHARDLDDYPDVLAYFGSQKPDDPNAEGPIVVRVYKREPQHDPLDSRQ
jgi:hypothetical protein